MSPLPLLDLLGLGVLLVALPAVSVLQLRTLEGIEIRRLPVYASSALTLVLLGLATLGLGLRRTDGAATLGLAPPPWSELWAWTAALTAVGLGIMFAFHAAARRMGLEESPLLEELLPRTPRERTAFAGLSLAAGVGEELAYRGYALPVLAALAGSWPAILLSAAAFAVMHAYQGGLGVARTGLLGVLLGWAFLASGSLWPVVLAHALLDILAGIVLADRLVGR